jgi:hypothetical protein
MFKHRVQYGKKFMHAGNDCDLLGLSRSAESDVHLTNDGVMPGGNQRSHVKCCPAPGATSPRATFTPFGTAVVVQGCYTY